MNLEQFVKRHQPPVTAMESFHDIDHHTAWLEVSIESHELLCEKVSQHIAFVAALETYAACYAQVDDVTQVSLENYELGLRAMFKAQELDFPDDMVPSLEDATEEAPDGEKPAVSAKALEMAKKAIAYVIEQIKKLYEKAKAWFAKSRSTNQLLEVQAHKAVQLLGNIKTPTVNPGGAPEATDGEEDDDKQPAAKPAEAEKPAAKAPRWMTYDGHFNVQNVVKMLQAYFAPPGILSTPNLFSKCTVAVSEQNYIGLTGMVQGADTGSPQLVIKALKVHHDERMEWGRTERTDDKIELVPIGEQQKSMLVSLAQKTEQLNGQRMQSFELFEKDYSRLMKELDAATTKQSATGANPGPDAAHIVTMLNSVFSMYAQEDAMAQGTIVAVLKALKPFADQGVTQAAA